MFSVTRKVSFSVVIALLLGWGVMSTLIFRSSGYLFEAQATDDTPLAVPGVQLNFQVDKKVYRQSDPILIALRNDSRTPITVATKADGCHDGWWYVQSLEGETWEPVVLTKATCTTKTYGLESFTRHTLKTGEWNGLVPGPQIGEIFMPAKTGTYRIAVPYQRGKKPVEAAWGLKANLVTTTSFTIQ